MENKAITFYEESDCPNFSQKIQEFVKNENTTESPIRSIKRNIYEIQMSYELFEKWEISKINNKCFSQKTTHYCDININEKKKKFPTASEKDQSKIFDDCLYIDDIYHEINSETVEEEEEEEEEKEKEKKDVQFYFYDKKNIPFDVIEKVYKKIEIYESVQKDYNDVYHTSLQTFFKLRLYEPSYETIKEVMVKRNEALEYNECNETLKKLKLSEEPATENGFCPLKMIWSDHELCTETENKTKLNSYEEEFLTLFNSNEQKEKKPLVLGSRSDVNYFRSNFTRYFKSNSFFSKLSSGVIEENTSLDLVKKHIFWSINLNKVQLYCHILNYFKHGKESTQFPIVFFKINYTSPYDRGIIKNKKNYKYLGYLSVKFKIPGDSFSRAFENGLDDKKNEQKNEQKQDNSQKLYAFYDNNSEEIEMTTYRGNIVYENHFNERYKVNYIELHILYIYCTTLEFVFIGNNIFIDNNIEKDEYPYYIIDKEGNKLSCNIIRQPYNELYHDDKSNKEIYVLQFKEFYEAHDIEEYCIYYNNIKTEIKIIRDFRLNIYRYKNFNKKTMFINSSSEYLEANQILLFSRNLIHNNNLEQVKLMKHPYLKIFLVSEFNNTYNEQEGGKISKQTQNKFEILKLSNFFKDNKKIIILYKFIFDQTIYHIYNFLYPGFFDKKQNTYIIYSDHFSVVEALTYINFYQNRHKINIQFLPTRAHQKKTLDTFEKYIQIVKKKYTQINLDIIREPQTINLTTSVMIHDFVNYNPGSYYFESCIKKSLRIIKKNLVNNGNIYVVFKDNTTENFYDSFVEKNILLKKYINYLNFHFEKKKVLFSEEITNPNLRTLKLYAFGFSNKPIPEKKIKNKINIQKVVEKKKERVKEFNKYADYILNTKNKKFLQNFLMNRAVQLARRLKLEINFKTDSFIKELIKHDHLFNNGTDISFTKDPNINIQHLFLKKKTKYESYPELLEIIDRNMKLGELFETKNLIKYEKIKSVIRVYGNTLKEYLRKKKIFYENHNVSQAWLKFQEILVKTNIVPPRKNITSMHYCESPGNFILSLEYYIKKNYKKLNWNAQTLNFNSKQNKEAIGDDYNMIKNNPTKWDWGSDGTGNIFNTNNILYYKNKYKNVDIVTLDCGIDWNSGDKKKSSKTICAQLIVLLLNTPIHKNGVCKLRTEFVSDPANIGLIFHIIHCFDDVKFYKPSINPWSQEFYIIAKNKNKIISEDEESIILSLLSDFDADHTHINLYGIPESYKTQLILIYKHIIDLHSFNIKRSIFYLDNYDKIFTDTSQRKKFQKIRDQKSRQWVKTFL